MRIAPWVMLLAVAATPTPAPVALQYDEITRTIVAPATPPAPGGFSDAYKLAMSARPMQRAESSSIETPTLKSKGIVGGGAELIPGEPGGSNTVESITDTVSNGASNGAATSSLGPIVSREMGAGYVVRYTFYFAKGWMRADYPFAQIAAIAKCDEHVLITLYLASKTYRQSSNDCSGGLPPSTEDLTVEATAPADLGSQTIDGISTTGSTVDMTMTASNATGVCGNVQLRFTRVAYVSKIPKPQAHYPPAWAPPLGADPAHQVVPGCEPMLHGSEASQSAAVSSALEMYVLTNYIESQGIVRHVIERGHVTVLDPSAADPLFEVPAGFIAAR